MDLKNNIKKIFRNEYLLISGILIFLICLFFRPILLGNRTLFPGSTMVAADGNYVYDSEARPTVVDPTSFMWTEVPTTIAASKMIHSGTPPLWNPYVGCGTPLAANLMSGIYNPLRFLLLLFPEPVIFDFYLLMRVFLAGLFTFILLRKIRISRISALISSVAYMFSGHFMCYLTLWHLNTDMLTPLLLFLFEFNVHEKKGKHTVFSGIGVALVLLAGSPQSALLSLTFASLYYFYRIVTLYGIRFNQGLLHKILNLVFILGIGFAISSFMLIDFYQFFQSSIHQINLPADGVKGIFNAHSPRSLVTFLFSPLQFLGTSLLSNIRNLSRFSRLFLFPYIGVITIILATMSLGKDWKVNRLSLFFMVYPCLLIFNLLGGGTWLYHQLGSFIFPLTRIFWAKYLGTLYLSAAILAGLGFENLKNKKLLSHLSTFFISCLILLVVACYYVNPIAYINTFEVSIPPAGMLGKLLLPIELSLSVRALIIAVVFVFLTAVLYRRGEFLYSLLAVMLFLELYLYHQPHYAVRHHPYPHSPYIDYLLKEKNKGEPFRICGLKIGMLPQISSVFGLEDVNNIDALYVKRYYTFMVDLILKKSWHYGVLSLIPGNIETVKNRYLNLLNVKYIISGDSLYPTKKDVLDLQGNLVPQKNYFLGRTPKSFFSLHPNTKDSIFHTDTAHFSYKVPPEGAILYFTPGIDPSQWSEEGDGVEFLVQVENNTALDVLFQKYYNPKENQADRRWFFEKTDLSPYREKEIKIIFKVNAGPSDDNRHDRCGFADIEIVPQSENKQKLSLVYNNEVKIYRNNTVMPRAYIVHRAEKIFQEEKIFKRLKDTHFDFRKNIVIEKDLPEKMLFCNNSPVSDLSSVKIVDYRPNRVELEATMENDGFLVLSDTYYPGWKAYVNDTQAEIYPTNYMLRSLYLTKGTHHIKFVYAPLPLKAGVGMSLLTLLGIAVFLCYKGKERNG